MQAENILHKYVENHVIPKLQIFGCSVSISLQSPSKEREMYLLTENYKTLNVGICSKVLSSYSKNICTRCSPNLPAYSLSYWDECFTWWATCSLLASYRWMKTVFSYHESRFAYAVDQDEQEVCWIENRLGEICFCVGREEAESLSPSIGEDSTAARCLVASSTYWRSSILVIKLKARLSITLE